MISRRNFLRFSGVAAASAGVIAVDTFIYEPRFALSVKDWAVRHPDWPAASKPLRIAILSDIHAMDPYMPASRIRDIAERAASLGADVIVLLGDYVAGLSKFPITPLPVSAWADALAPLKAPLGVYAVLGNHDWWEKAVPEIRTAFRRLDIQLLENKAVKIKKSGFDFWMAGLGDQLAYFGKGVDDLPGTMRQITDAAPVVLLAHEPDIFPSVPSRVTVTLSGHTHGGQVYIPFYGRPIIPSRYGQRYAYGHIQEQGKHLVVSAGLGLSKIPVRFLVPPEITLVTVSNT